MIRDLTLDDALAVVRAMREQDRACVRAAAGEIDDEVFAVDRWQTNGPAWTLLQDGVPVAIYGLQLTNDWTALAWLIAAPWISRESWRKLIRHCRTVRSNLADPGNGAHRRRVEACVLGSWPEAAALVRRLGFELEGTKRQAGRQGEDLQLWAIVNEGG